MPNTKKKNLLSKFLTSKKDKQAISWIRKHKFKTLATILAGMGYVLSRQLNVRTLEIYDSIKNTPKYAIQTNNSLTSAPLIQNSYYNIKMYKVCTDNNWKTKVLPIRPEHLSFNEDKFGILYNTKNNTFYCQYISCKTEGQYNKYTFKIMYDTKQPHENLIEISIIKINEANLKRNIWHVDIKRKKDDFNFYTDICYALETDKQSSYIPRSPSDECEEWS